MITKYIENISPFSSKNLLFKEFQDSIYAALNQGLSKAESCAHERGPATASQWKLVGREPGIYRVLKSQPHCETEMNKRREGCWVTLQQIGKWLAQLIEVSVSKTCNIDIGEFK